MFYQHHSVKKATIVLAVFTILFLFVSSVTAVPQTQGSQILQTLKKTKHSQQILTAFQSLRERCRTSSLLSLKKSQPQGFLQVMVTLMINLIVTLAQLTKGVTIGLINLAVVLIKLTGILLIGTQKTLTVSSIMILYLGVKVTLGMMKFFKAATPVTAKMASVLASIITPIIGLLVSGAVFAVTTIAALALLLAIPLAILLIMQSLTGGDTILDSILDFLDDLFSSPAPEEE